MRTRLLRRAMACALTVAAAGAMPAAGAASGFPERPIRLVVAFAPGTSSDALARLLAEGLRDALGQSVVVENRPGGGGITGTAFVANAPPDGYTLTLGTTSTLVTSPLLNENANYRADRNFVAVTGLARSHFIIGTSASAGAPHTLPELVTRLKQGAGNYATSGVGTVVHLTAVRFLSAADAQATHVPYAGSAASLADVAAGHVMFSAETMAATIPLVQGGKLRALAVTSPERNSALPEVPTVRESGYPDFVAYSWFGLMAPAGTPPDVLATLDRATRKVMSTDAMRQRLTALAFDPLDMSLGEFDAFIASELPSWKTVLDRAGIELN